jgi:hypothetical protein
LQKVEEAHKCFADVQHKMDEKVDDIHKMLLQWNLNSEFGSSQKSPQTTARLSSLLSGPNVAGSRDDCRHLDLLCLVAKPPYVEVDVEGLRYACAGL